MSDQDRISPYNQPDKEMKRKKEKHQQGKKNWSKTKFSERTFQELYGEK